jgi:hypothetical protein
VIRVAPAPGAEPSDLARLREILDQQRGTKDAQTLDLMHEAEALIAPPRATTER